MVVVTVGAVLTFKYVKETKNKTYEEIAQMYYGEVRGDLIIVNTPLETMDHEEHKGSTRDLRDQGEKGVNEGYTRTMKMGKASLKRS